MIVMKFGGTSVRDAAAMDNAIKIISRQLERSPVVVLSAIAGATNRLLEIAGLAGRGLADEAVSLLEEERQRHLDLAEALLNERRGKIRAEIDAHFEQASNLVRGLSILRELTPRSLDAIASYGERLSTLIISAAMLERNIRAQLLDARSIVITDDNFTRANPLLEEIEQRARAALLPALESGLVPVTQGYIGATRDGITTTLGRGGSDYTAALLGAALNAEEIQIWTDVDGMLTADPRLVPGARRIKVLSFAEASELAYFGAKVLHPSTIQPAIRRNIPVRIFNSHRPDAGGTLITSQIAPSRGDIKAIACKRGITMINVYSTRMLMAYGFMKKIFDVFDRYQTPVDLVSTSEVSVSITVDSREHLDEIVRELGGFARVTVEDNKAIVCVVGEQLKFTPGIAGRVFKTIEDINVYMISQGASEINLSFVVDEEQAQRVVAALHREFFPEGAAGDLD